MNNLEISFRTANVFNEATTGEITENSVEDNISCFTTKLNRLFICKIMENPHYVDLDDRLKGPRHLKHLKFWQYLFIATDTDLIIYTPGTKKFFFVYSFTAKIICTSWNPNETYLVVLDQDNVMYGFTFEVNTDLQQFKFIEANKSCLDDVVPNSVYVGWGSHITQFRGSKKKEAEVVKEIPQDYSPPKISWRGNGEQFVINFWKDKKRFLKVFDSFLRPLYESDVYLNLLAPTSFKGQGNFIACAAEHNLSNKIVIFEKNCLVKSEFFVTENKGKIKDIQYHPDMHILAVYSEEVSGTGYLNIYLNSNAKWYLKQQLTYSLNKKLMSFNWDSHLDKTLCTLNVLSSKAIEQIIFRLIINWYPQHGVVANIDGVHIHFTTFSDQIIPPPMSSTTLTFKRAVNRIVFNEPLNMFQFYLSDNSVKGYTFDNGQFEKYTGEEFLPLDLNENNKGNIIYLIKKIIDNVSYELVLDRKQDLLINHSVVCSNVLSLFIHKNYLLFTHASCKLFCIRLTNESINSSTWNLNKLYSREVEQGAKIVCVTNNSDIVLEMPRGNLETITCRLIALDMVENLLVQNKWGDAVYQIRQQRLNWNLLIDLNPRRFSEHIKEFVEAAKTVSLLNTIVSEFSNEDFLKNMYSHCFKNDTTFTEHDKTKVLAEILDYIILLNPIFNLVSIATLQIKHFSLKSALNSVCTVFELGDVDVSKKAIFQILLHTHAKNVINEAFTLYNINFMNFIYTSCSEDPRLFEPELKKLQGLEPIELRFQMNVLGKNFKGATKYLVRCAKYDQQFISDFIKKYSTYSIAYESVSPKHSNFVLCSKLFAKYLAVKTRHNEAALVFERAKLYEEALEEYRKALNWHQVVSLLEQLNVDESSKQDMLQELADELIKGKQIDEAVILLEHYCGQHAKAIEVLTEKKMFQRALGLARKYKCDDMIDNMIKPSIIKHRIDLCERITELGSKFSDYTSRLQNLRNKRLRNLKNRYLESENNENYENDDLYSEYGSIISSRGSSIGSRSSRGSTLSSRNRRKQEKKKIDLREGGVYEDIALIRQLYLLITDIFSCGQDVKEVCLTLTDDHSFIFSKMLHEKLITIQDMVKLSIAKIWSEVFLNAQESLEPEILAVIQNRAELDLEFRNPPASDKMNESWKLFIFNEK